MEAAANYVQNQQLRIRQEHENLLKRQIDERDFVQSVSVRNDREHRQNLHVKQIMSAAQVDQEIQN